jgi:hypothetical protein
MIALVLAAALLAPNSAVSQDQATQAGQMTTRHALPIPNGITSEILPYVNCLNEQTSAAFRELSPVSEERFPEIKSKALTGCAIARATAKQAAIKALGGTEIPRKKRPEYVESAIVDVENAVLISPWTESESAKDAAK